MAVVYKVRHETLKTPICFEDSKSIPSSNPREDDKRRTSASLLRHPNVVAVNDVITVDGNLCLVMGSIEGMAMMNGLTKMICHWNKQKNLSKY